MQTAVAACAQVLRESILSGRLPAGVRLPTERALAEQFGVHRSTVRSALAQLEAEHLLSVRQGSGYTVHDFRRDAGPTLIATLAALAGSDAERTAIVRDLLFVRRTLARAVLERLSERPDEAGLRRADAAVDRLDGLAAEGAAIEEIARADLDCVASLVAATNSTVLELCMNPVASLLGRMPELQRAMYREPLANVAAFRAVLAWVRSKRRAGIDVLLDRLARLDQATLAALAPKRRER